MATLTFQVRTYHRLPIHAPLYFHTEHIQDTGALWKVSRDGCRMDANVPPHSETLVELMLLLGAIGAVYVKAATVCWTTRSRMWPAFHPRSAGEAAHLERYLSQRIVEAVHVQYPSR